MSEDESVHADPIAPEALPQLLAELIAGHGVGRLNIAVDGAPATHPEQMAESVATALRVLGRPAFRVSAGDFLRPASVRLEHGRQDPQAYRSGWLDASALRREVIEPFRTSGRYLPSLWDATRDRATRAAPVSTPPGALLLVNGTLLLDKGLRFDLTVHLSLSRAALARQTAAELKWTLPAYEGYPGVARPDAVVRLDDPRHPALVRS